MGQVVKAKLLLFESEDPLELAERLRKFCMTRMAKFKVPIKYEISSEEDHHTLRFKKLRGKNI